MFDSANFLRALSVCLQPAQIMALLTGSILGVTMGAIPGASATLAIAILIPITYWTSTEFSIISLMAAYTCGIFGGSITAILLNIPGTPASAATCYDGYPLAMQGKGGKAIACAIWGSFFGGVISAFCLLFCAPLLADVAGRLGALELALVALFGMTMVATLSSENLAKGLLMAAIGLVIGCVGVEDQTGSVRFTFKIMHLYSGIPHTPLLIGMFAFPQVMSMCTAKDSIVHGLGKNDKIALNRGEIKRVGKTAGISAIIGLIIGLIPAIGPETATFMAYDRAKQISKTPEKFGTGMIEGVVASETANNAVVGASLAPTFALGIPGSGAAMMLMGGLTVHGLQPGPFLFENSGDIMMTLFVGMFFCQMMILATGFPLAKFTPKLLSIPQNILGPTILMLCMVACYVSEGDLFSILIMAIAGMISYLLLKSGFSVVPLLLGVILGKTFESYLSRASVLASTKGGLVPYFMSRPVAWIILVVILATLFLPKLLKQKSLAMDKKEVGE